VKRLVILVIVLMVVGPLSANELEVMPGKWWEDERIVEHIGLTDEQREQIRDIVFEHARIMIDLKADFDKAGLDLAASVDQQDFDPVPVRAAHAVFQTARQKLENERFEMLIRVRQILSYEQWQKIQEVKRRFEQNRSQRRPGARGQQSRRPPAERPPGF
jgi:Spy/CpxP family protein refolding chaperone